MPWRGMRAALRVGMRILLALFLVTAACADDGPATYLALGDSIAFGYDPSTDHSSDAGYPELLAQRRGLALSNAACPGEASGGFLSETGDDNGCRENRMKYAL